MKKTTSLILALLLTFSLVSNSIALAKDKDKVPTVVIDTEKKPIKEFTPAAVGKDVSAESAPYWSVRSIYRGLEHSGEALSDSYTSSSKSARSPINYILAKARLYYNSAIDSSKSDSATNASHAGAYTLCAAGLLGHLIGDHETYGNHSFEKTGYQSWYPETHDT